VEPATNLVNDLYEKNEKKSVDENITASKN
jgi:hypothetical protein